MLGITDVAIALDFDIAIAERAAQIESGEPISVEEQVQRRRQGFKALKLYCNQARTPAEKAAAVLPVVEKSSK